MAGRFRSGLPKVILQRPLPASVVKFRAAESPWNRWKIEGDSKIGNIHIKQREMTIGVVKTLPVGQTILDLGCGTGKTLDELLRLGNVERVLAIDINKNAINMAQEKLKEGNNPHVNKLEVAEADLYKYPFKPGSADCVICIDVLNELSDFTKALSIMRDILKPNGMLIGNFVAKEKFVELMLKTHSPLEYSWLDFKFHAALAISFNQAVYNYFGRKGYIRLLPCLKNDVIGMLEKFFKIEIMNSDFYHWFTASAKPDNRSTVKR
jgi:ubiquinone/menaquinone biosynthesis C-methylase UbiE